MNSRALSELSTATNAHEQIHCQKASKACTITTGGQQATNRTTRRCRVTGHDGVPCNEGIGKRTCRAQPPVMYGNRHSAHVAYSELQTTQDAVSAERTVNAQELILSISRDGVNTIDKPTVRAH